MYGQGLGSYLVKWGVHNKQGGGVSKEMKFHKKGGHNKRELVEKIKFSESTPPLLLGTRE